MPKIGTPVSVEVGRARRAGARTAGLALALALAVLAPSAARGGSCSVAVGSSVAFGAYDPFSQVPTDSVGTITFRCSQSTPLRISLDAGQAGSFARRLLTNGVDALGYNLYLDAARRVIWGDGTAGTGTGPGVVTAGSPDDTTYVFGRIDPLQNVSVGTYSDAVRVTFDF